MTGASASARRAHSRLLVAQVDQRVEGVAVRDRRRQLGFVLGRAQLHADAAAPPASRTRSPATRAAEDALAPGGRRARRDLVGEPARPRGVARQQHPVDRAQQPVLALLAGRAQAARGDQRRRRLRPLVRRRVRTRPAARRAARPAPRGRGQVPQRDGLFFVHVGRGDDAAPPAAPDRAARRPRGAPAARSRCRHAGRVGPARPAATASSSAAKRVDAGESGRLGEPTPPPSTAAASTSGRRLAARQAERTSAASSQRGRQRALEVLPRVRRQLASSARAAAGRRRRASTAAAQPRPRAGASERRSSG